MGRSDLQRMIREELPTVGLQGELPLVDVHDDVRNDVRRELPTYGLPDLSDDASLIEDDEDLDLLEVAEEPSVVLAEDTSEDAPTLAIPQRRSAQRMRVAAPAVALPRSNAARLAQARRALDEDAPTVIPARAAQVPEPAMIVASAPALPVAPVASPVRVAPVASVASPVRVAPLLDRAPAESALSAVDVWFAETPVRAIDIETMRTRERGHKDRGRSVAFFGISASLAMAALVCAISAVVSATTSDDAADRANGAAATARADESWVMPAAGDRVIAKAAEARAAAR